MSKRSSTENRAPATIDPLEPRRLFAAAPVTLAGTVFGTAGVDPATLALATDGNLATAVDVPTTPDGVTVGVDLGSAKAVGRVAFAPRAGFAARMAGGLFQASNDPTFATGVKNIAKLKKAPKDGKLTLIATGGKTFRYWRYVAPNGSYGDLAELQLYAPAGATAPTTDGVLTGTATFGTEGSFHNGKNTVDKATDNNRATFFNAPSPDGAIVGIDLGASRTVDEIAFAPRPQFAKRMVGGSFQASDDATFTTGVATLYTVASAPAGNRVTVVGTDTAAAYRYWRYVAPAGSYGNVAEFQLYAASATPTPTPTPTPTSIAVAPAADQSATAGTSHAFDLGSFTATNATAPFTVDVNWGDGTADATFTVTDPGAIGVQAHTYASAGSDTVSVTVADAAGTAAPAVTFSVTVAAPTPTPTPTTTITVAPPAAQSATAGAAQLFDVGSFDAANATDPYTVTVDWGDGSAVTTVMVSEPGAIDPQSHAYAAVGTDSATVTVTDSAGHASTPATFAVTVTAATTPTPTPTPTPTDFTQITWTTKAAGPVTRSEALKAKVNDKLYVFGGYDTNTGPMLRSDVYDPATDTWARIHDLPEELTHVGMAVDGNLVYLVGGYVGRGNNTFAQTFGTNHVWVYDTAADTFTAGPSLPAAYAGGGAAIVGRTLHYFGGFVLANRADTNVHLTLNLDNPSAGWTTAASMLKGVSHMGAEVFNGKIYAIAGQTGYDANLVTQSVVQIYDPATNTWSYGANMPAARSHTASATFIMDDRIIVMGGESANEVQAKECYAYTPATNTWVQLTSLPTPRFSGVADVFNGKIIFTSGGNSNTTYQGTPVTT